MYAKYAYKSTATQAQVLRDLILILTGTTNTGSLSASCDTANTSIDTTLGTTGNNNDNDSGASANTTQGFRMSVHDNATEYFYVALTIAAATLQIGLWDAWNGTSHVGVAPGALNTASLTIPTIGTTGGTLHVWSDGKGVLIQSTLNNQYQPLGVVQFTRDDAWRTIANGCKPVVCFGVNTLGGGGTTWSASVAFTLKSINATPAFVSAGTAYANAMGPVPDIPSTSGSNGSYMGRLDSSLVSKNSLLPARAGGNGSAVGTWIYGGAVSSLSPLYFHTGNSAAVIGDDITYGAETYRVFSYGGASTNYCRLCVRIS